MRFHIVAVLTALFSLVVSPLIAAEVLLTVTEASLPEETSESRSAVVYVRLDPESTQAFAEFSAAHIGEMAEMFVGDRLVFAALLREVITNGSLALFVGGEDERLSNEHDLLEQLETGAPIRAVAPASEQ